MFEYQAKILRVIDGDTVEAEVDLGFNIKMNMKLRLAGINAPEMTTPEGKESKVALVTMIEGKTVTVLSQKDKQEKYGRYLATILCDRISINEWLVEHKLAERYIG
jgi:micrococcal nuclease